MTRTSRVALMALAFWCVLADMDSTAQLVGTTQRVRIRFISIPSKAQFNFVFEGQKVSGKTPATKVFTLRDDKEVTVTFSEHGYENCQKKFSARWPQNGAQGALIVDGEEQILSFSSGAKPSEVTCELRKEQPR